MIDPAYLVGAGGAIGAASRQFVSSHVDHVAFPTGTLTVNVLGSFVLGLVTFVGLDASALLFLGTGACGSFTTFSSFSVETVRLWETGRATAAVGYALVNLLGALAAIGLAGGVATML